MEDLSKYSHSPAHLAVLRRDHVGLRRLVTSLPPLPRAGDVATESESVAAELVADSVSAVIDRRDVPNRETPLHLAVRLRDPISAEVLMSAGADWSLQNAHGWSALQEAVCTREDSIAMIIARHYQPLAWAKWCRRLPRIVSSISRVRDFYMEITFHFESSVIPFIGRIAPSDTYRIWKRGPNLRADMTLAGFDGFRIQRSDQTFMFLGEGDAERNLPAGSLIVLAHKEKEITNALEGAGAKPTEAEVAHEVALMSQTNMYRPGIDVTQAELVPHLNWRRQERTEMVGNWKGKVYDMLHVMVSVKSRRVPGAMTDEELFAIDNEERMANGGDHNEELDDVLTVEERKQLDSALRMGDSEGAVEEEMSGVSDYLDSTESNGVAKEKKSWFGWNNKRASKSNGCEDSEDPKMLKKFSKLAPENGNTKYEFGKDDAGDVKKGKEKSSGKKKKNGVTGDSSKHESEYKKGLRPVLWLTPDFPLKTDELLPLLDVLANKVKAIRRLRELLTTKLPQGTFPVKVAIPIVPTIRVLITFTKFEELPPFDEFATPLSSPTNFQDSKGKDIESSSSWYSWVRGSRGGQSTDSSESRSWKDEVDPFHIPPDYTWIDANEKKRRMKAKKAKSRRSAGKKQSSRSAEGHQLTDGFEE
ncbi:ankyrin repeat domain-containing protein 13C-like [Iris pallida]|uniref:Ankyrin repeat domain-containing protein 13C-like n=1 Tax=Iris pallida TaxID=29817 RepID=A0AAX6FVM1_IRIPA|nr:ankyrin repeat domain-containing protein 13C-like [Iris pallida]